MDDSGLCRSPPATSFPAGESGSRLSSLDVIRGVAILGVVLWHLRQLTWTRAIVHYYPNFIMPYLDKPSIRGLTSIVGLEDWALAPLDVIANLGYQGVHLFLAASGFGLSLSWERLVERDGGGSAWRRYRRWLAHRAWRLFPLLWITLALVLSALHLFGPRGLYEAPTFTDDPAQWWRLTWISALGINALSDKTMWSTSVPLWFTTILIQFYLVFPVLHALLRRSGPLGFMGLMAALTAVSRWLVIDPLPAGHHFLAFGGFFGCRSVEFAAGMCLAARFQQTGELWRPRSSAALGAGLAYVLGLVLAGNRWGSIVADAVIGASLFLMLYGIIVRLEGAPGLGRRTLGLLGAYSFGIFLAHFPLQHPLSNFYLWLLPWRNTVALLVVALLVVATGVSAGIGFERLGNRILLCRRGREPPGITRCAADSRPGRP